MESNDKMKSIMLKPELIFNKSKTSDIKETNRVTYEKILGINNKHEEKKEISKWQQSKWMLHGHAPRNILE